MSVRCAKRVYASRSPRFLLCRRQWLQRRFGALLHNSGRRRAWSRPAEPPVKAIHPESKHQPGLKASSRCTPKGGGNASSAGATPYERGRTHEERGRSQEERGRSKAPPQSRGRSTSETRRRQRSSSRQSGTRSSSVSSFRRDLRTGAVFNSKYYQSDRGLSYITRHRARELHMATSTVWTDGIIRHIKAHVYKKVKIKRATLPSSK